MLKKVTFISALLGVLASFLVIHVHKPDIHLKLNKL